MLHFHPVFFSLKTIMEHFFPGVHGIKLNLEMIKDEVGWNIGRLHNATFPPCIFLLEDNNGAFFPRGPRN